jgi:hypothetical protein
MRGLNLIPGAIRDASVEKSLIPDMDAYAAAATIRLLCRGRIGSGGRQEPMRRMSK